LLDGEGQVRDPKLLEVAGPVIEMEKTG